MPPHPKRKHSSGRRDRRRAHDFLTPTHLIACENCGEMHLPHTMCPKCGHYRNREVVDMEAAEKKKK
jgi:large subunit ribosomal protein L32